MIRSIQAQRNTCIAFLGVVLVLYFSGCGEKNDQSDEPIPPSQTPKDNAWLEDVAADSGLIFMHQSGHDEDFLMPEIMGGGVALFDMDGDGDLDAYFVQSGRLVTTGDSGGPLPRNRLFRNRGDGRFDDVTEGSGADDAGYGMGVACADYDNDGDVDLYITNVGANVLLRNDGDGRFTDVTLAAGVGDVGWGTSAAFTDYDRDGDLDLVVLNYLNWSASTEMICYSAMGTSDYCSPQTYSAPARDVLYRNEGDGTFTDVTVDAGVIDLGTGLGIACGDFDGDDWPDIFIANDGMLDRLWMNQGDGTFTEQALMLGCAVDSDGQAKAGMGVAAADIDDDGDLDLLVCNLNKQTDSFFINEGGTFTDRTALAGLAVASRSFTRFGMAWVDFDNDGMLDLYQANGRVMQQAHTYSDDLYAEPNLLFRGTGEGAFEEMIPRGGTNTLLVGTSRAAAFGDVDNDGGIDVVVVQRDAAAYLLRNVCENRGNWITFRVVDEHQRDAIGATIVIEMGDRTVTRDVRAAYSYLASNDPRIHIGLGSLESIDDVTVEWIDGTRERFGGQSHGRIVTLRKGEGNPELP